MSDVKEVTAGQPKVGGAVFRAPIGTPLPTDAVTALDSAFKDMGYISADGLTESVSPESETIKDWGGETVFTTMTGRTATVKAKFISALNMEVQKMVHSDANVSGDLQTGLTVKVNSAELDHYIYVFEMIERGGVLHRVVLPDAIPSEIGDVTYVKNDVVGYDVTLTGMSDSTGNSIYHYRAVGAEEETADEDGE